MKPFQEIHLRKRTKIERLMWLRWAFKGHYRLNRKHMRFLPAVYWAARMASVILKD